MTAAPPIDARLRLLPQATISPAAAPQEQIPPPPSVITVSAVAVVLTMAPNAKPVPKSSTTATPEHSGEAHGLTAFMMKPQASLCPPPRSVNAVYPGRCLLEGAGDVAFVKHTTVAENTGGESAIRFCPDRLSLQNPHRYSHRQTHTPCPCCFVKATLQRGLQMQTRTTTSCSAQIRKQASGTLPVATWLKCPHMLW